MADPFGLVNRPLGRMAAAGRGGAAAAGYPGGRRRKPLDLSDPKSVEYLRRMHPDFDEVMCLSSIDYRTQCHTDANFASKYRIPPVLEPTCSFREHTNSVDAVCWGPEPGTFISASHDATLKVWDARTRKCTATLTGHVAGVYHCAVAPSGRLVASCGSGEEKNALLWKWPEQMVVGALKGHKRSVVHVAFSEDSSLASTTDQEGNVAVHDLARGACKVVMSPHWGPALGSSFCREDPNLLCSAGADGNWQLLDLRERCAPQAWRLPSSVANSVRLNITMAAKGAHDGYAVHAVEFVDRTTLFTGGADHKLKRWDLRSVAPWRPKCAGEYRGHTAPVRCLAVAPDQRYAVSGCEDGSLRVWRRDPLGEVRSTLRGLRAQVKQVEAQLEDVERPATERQELGQLRDKLKASMASSREEEEHLARDAYVSAVRTLNGHVSQVSGCAWKEDSAKSVVSILSSSWDQSIQLFDVSLAELS